MAIMSLSDSIEQLAPPSHTADPTSSRARDDTPAHAIPKYSDFWAGHARMGGSASPPAKPPTSAANPSAGTSREFPDAATEGTARSTFSALSTAVSSPQGGSVMSSVSAAGAADAGARGEPPRELPQFFVRLLGRLRTLVTDKFSVRFMHACRLPCLQHANPYTWMILLSLSVRCASLRASAPSCKRRYEGRACCRGRAPLTTM